MPTHDYDPTAGQAYQGDVSIVPIPAEIEIDDRTEIPAIAGRLILMAGEVTGHHHAIDVMPARSRAADSLMADALAERIPISGRATLYRVGSVARRMMDAGILTRSDLATSVLVVEDAPALLSHEEHDTIRLAPGRYLIGRQVESAGAEERRVAD